MITKHFYLSLVVLSIAVGTGSPSIAQTSPKVGMQTYQNPIYQNFAYQQAQEAAALQAQQQLNDGLKKGVTDAITPQSLWPSKIDNKSSEVKNKSKVSAPIDLPPINDNASSTLLWNIDPVQNLRQSGESSPQARSFGVASVHSREDQIFLEEWRQELLGFGFPLSKINFEAQRLDRHSFGLWASRLVWWKKQQQCQNTINTSN